MSKTNYFKGGFKLNIENICVTRHFSFRIRLSAVKGGKDQYMDYAISVPSTFNIPEDDIPMINSIFIDMIKKDFNVHQNIIESISNQQYLADCGLDFFDE